MRAKSKRIADATRGRRTVRTGAGEWHAKLGIGSKTPNLPSSPANAMPKGGRIAWKSRIESVSSRAEYCDSDAESQVVTTGCFVRRSGSVENAGIGVELTHGCHLNGRTLVWPALASDDGVVQFPQPAEFRQDFPSACVRIFLPILQLRYGGLSCYSIKMAGSVVMRTDIATAIIAFFFFASTGLGTYLVLIRLFFPCRAQIKGDSASALVSNPQETR